MITILDKEFKSIAQIALELSILNDINPYNYSRLNLKHEIDNNVKPIVGVKFIDGSWLGINSNTKKYQATWYWQWLG